MFSFRRPERGASSPGFSRILGVTMAISALLASSVSAVGAQETGADDTAEASVMPEYSLAELLPDSQIFHPDVLSQVMPTSSRVTTLRL